VELCGACGPYCLYLSDRSGCGAPSPTDEREGKGATDASTTDVGHLQRCRPAYAHCYGDGARRSWTVHTNVELCTPVLDCAHNCGTVHTSPGLCTQVLGGAHQPWTLYSDLGLCTPLWNCAHRSWAVQTALDQHRDGMGTEPAPPQQKSPTFPVMHSKQHASRSTQHTNQAHYPAPAPDPLYLQKLFLQPQTDPRSLLVI